jgi:hypothetical protein
MPRLVPLDDIEGSLESTERAAQVSACRKAIKKLRELNFLDGLYRPAHFKAPELGIAFQDDSNYDRKLIRSYKPINSWPCKRADDADESWSRKFELYTIIVEGDPSCEGVAVCLLTEGLLQHPFPPITLRTYTATSEAKIERVGSVSLSSDSELELLRLSHLGFFREVLPTLPPAGESPSWAPNAAGRSYLVAPAKRSQSGWNIDWDAVAFLSGTQHEPKYLQIAIDERNHEENLEKLRQTILIARHTRNRGLSSTVTGRDVSDATGRLEEGNVACRLQRQVLFLH